MVATQVVVAIITHAWNITAQAIGMVCTIEMLDVRRWVTGMHMQDCHAMCTALVGDGEQMSTIWRKCNVEGFEFRV